MSAKFSLKTKLLLLCGFMSLIPIAVGSISFFGLRNISSTYEKVTGEVLPKTQSIDQMFLHFRNIRISLRSLGLPGVDKVQAEKFIKEVQDNIAGYEKYRKQYESLPFSKEEKALNDKVNATWEEFKGVGDEVLSLYAQGTEEADKRILEIFLVDCPRYANLYTEAMEELVAYHSKNATVWVQEAQEVNHETNSVVILTIALGVLAGLGTGTYFAFSLSKSIRSVSDELALGADEVTKAAAKISSTSLTLSQSTTSQASSLEQTAASIEEMSSMVKKNAENAQRTSDVAENSQKSATKGKEVVQNMITAINEINVSNSTIMDAINESNAKISEIVTVIADIGEKTKVINDIVFQTKLLSFNASVEAARAGEHGKGFAVVAEEVGNLAQMSGNAAHEISQMLGESIKKVETTVSETKLKIETLIWDGKSKVETGTHIAHQCGDVLDEITHNIISVTQMANEISTACREQAQGVHEITKAMNALGQVTQDNASTSEESAESSKELSTQADTLHSMVQVLMDTVNGAKAA